MISEPLLGKKRRCSTNWSFFVVLLVLFIFFLLLFARKNVNETAVMANKRIVTLNSGRRQQLHYSPEDIASVSVRERAGEHYQHNWMYNNLSKHWFSLWCRWNPKGDLLTRFNAERILEPDGKGGTVHRNVYHFRDERGTVSEGELCGPWLINEACSKEDGLIHPSRNYMRMFMGPRGAAAWITPVLPKESSGMPTVAELFLHHGIDIRMSVGLVWNKDADLQSIALIREDARGPFPSPAWSESSSSRVVSPEEMLNIFVGQGGPDSISLGFGNVTSANLYQQPAYNVKFFSTRLASVHPRRDIVMLLDEDRVAIVTPKRKKRDLHCAIMWRPRDTDVIRTMEITWADGKFLRIRALKFHYVDPKTNPDRNHIGGRPAPQEQRQTRSEGNYIMPRQSSPNVIQGPSDVFSPRQSRQVPADFNALLPATAAIPPSDGSFKKLVDTYSRSPSDTSDTLYSRSPASDTSFEYSPPDKYEDDETHGSMPIPIRRESDPPQLYSTVLNRSNLRRIQSEPHGSAIMGTGANSAAEQSRLILPGFDHGGPSRSVPVPVPGVRRTQSDTNMDNDDSKIHRSPPLFDFSRSPPAGTPPLNVASVDRPKGMSPLSLPSASLPTLSISQQNNPSSSLSKRIQDEMEQPYVRYKPGRDTSVPSGNPPSIPHELTIMNWGKAEPHSPGGTKSSSEAGPSLGGLDRLRIDSSQAGPSSLGLERAYSQEGSDNDSVNTFETLGGPTDSEPTSQSGSTQNSPRMARTKSMPLPKQFAAELYPLPESRGPTPTVSGPGTPGSSPLKKSISSPHLSSLSGSTTNKLPSVPSSPAIYRQGHSSDEDDH